MHNPDLMHINTKIGKNRDKQELCNFKKFFLKKDYVQNNKKPGFHADWTNGWPNG